MNKQSQNKQQQQYREQRAEHPSYRSIKPKTEGTCTFCGAEIEDDEMFCSECGSPRNGIICPQCGTMNYRSFCSHCNAPLNDNAYQALEEAKSDPKFQRAQKLADEVSELEEYLLNLKDEIEAAMAQDEAEGDAPEPPGLSTEGEKLQNKYSELMQLLGKAAAPPPQTAQTPQPIRHNRRKQMQAKFYEAESIMEAYRAKSAEMQAAMAEMMPEPSMTPCQQRDYVAARKVAMMGTRKERRPLYWTCNLCGFPHNHPSECAQPDLGGVWTYQEVDVPTRIWRYVND